MFTGIVKEVGRVLSAQRGDDGARLEIGATFVPDLSDGDSVAVSGVCLTVAGLSEGAFAADVMNQTLELTTLGGLAEGDRVNLEPALKAGDPLGGHIVQGHVDCRAEVVDAREDGFARRLRIFLPEEHRPLVVEHGSVTVDGVSLTVAVLTDDGFEVSLIPETLERTTLGDTGPANVELDVIGRYVQRLLRFNEKGAP
jgi:riboflavin synthase